MTLTPEQFIAKLRGMTTKISDMDHSRALDESSVVVYEGIGQNFNRQVDETGAIWPPRKDKLPHPLLRLTLAMSTAATGGPGSIKIVEKKRLVLAISKAVVPYSKVHQDGLGRVPRRRYFYLHEEDRPRVLARFRQIENEEFRKQVLS